MNKTHLTIGIIIMSLIIILVTHFLISKPKVKTISLSPEILDSIKYTPDEEENETEPKKPTLDLTKLQGKDRLYTEEEGKYENLTEEEQQVFIEAYYCRQYNKNGKKACMHNIEVYGLEINNKARLVALKDGMAVFYSEGEGMPKGRLYIYDLKNGELVREIIDSGYIAFGPDFIIMAENLSQNSQVLQLYRPGMSDFIDIPDSQSQGAEYVGQNNQFSRDFQIEFGINSITTYLHTFKNCENQGMYIAPGFYQCEIDTKIPKTFDISNLP